MNPVDGTNIRLRLLIAEDAEFLFANINDPDIRKQLRELPDPLTLEHELEFIAKVNAEAVAGESFHFGIELKGADQIAGVIGALYPDGNRDTAEIGYWIAKKFWGRGIVSEAIALITRYLQAEKNVKLIIANVFQDNLGSIKALEKNYFINSGLAKEQYCNKINTAPIIRFEKTF